MVRPSSAARAPVAELTSMDTAMVHFPGVTAHNFFHGQLDVPRLREAFARVVERNPLLAGRIRSTGQFEGDGSPILQVQLEGSTGCAFHVKQLAPELEERLLAFSTAELATRPLEWELMVEQLGIENTGIGEHQIDKDGPLCTATVVTGSKMTVLSLSVSHLLGDGSTKFQVLRAWDAEFAAPGSTEPMSDRSAVVSSDKEVKSKYSSWERAALEAFYPKIYQRHYLSRDLAEYHMVVVNATSDMLSKIKSAQKATLADPSAKFSTQDALVAWLGNVLGAKWFSFTVDLRGRHESLPANCMANAFQTWYGVPQAGKGKFSAMDVRRLIQSQGADPAAALEEALTTGLEDSIDVNSWVKLQYLPSFGGKIWKQVRAIGLSSLPFVCCINYHVIYQVEKGEHVMFHFGLKEDEAKALELAWRALGASAIGRVSGRELAEASSARR